MTAVLDDIMRAARRRVERLQQPQAEPVRRAALQAAGIQAFLVGESLVVAADPAAKLCAPRRMESTCPS